LHWRVPEPAARSVFGNPCGEINPVRDFSGGSAYFPLRRAVDRLMSILKSVPNALIGLFWLLVAIILVTVAALIIHHFGGFALSFHIGDFSFNLGVS
jgi:hypothetical protein